MASTALQAAKYLCKHSDELHSLIRREDAPFVSACKRLGFGSHQDMRRLLPMKMSQRKERNGKEDDIEELYRIQQHESWREKMLELVVREQMRAANDERLDSEESRLSRIRQKRVEDAIDQERLTFEENIEKQWKRVYATHKDQLIASRFPSRRTYERWKKREKRARSGTFKAKEKYLSKQERLKQIQEKAAEKEEHHRHCAEWRTWERMQTRWTLTAKLDKKSRRTQNFLSKKRENVSQVRQRARREEAACFPRSSDIRRETADTLLERRIEKKLLEATARRREMNEKDALVVAMRRVREDQRIEDARRQRRALEWKTLQKAARKASEERARNSTLSEV